MMDEKTKLKFMLYSGHDATRKYMLEILALCLCFVFKCKVTFHIKKLDLWLQYVNNPNRMYYCINLAQE